MKNTLWKTCRVLANRTRLHILRRLIRNTELCVRDIAQAEQLSEVVASQHLRLLHEHGFLEQKRKSKWVYYKMAVSAGSHAKHLITPLKSKLGSQRPCSNDLMRMVTAFTHPRRIDIVKILLNKESSFEQLITECNISGQALYRHLNKLIDRKLVVQKNNVYRILRPKDGLLKALLLCCNEEPFSHTS